MQVSFKADTIDMTAWDRPVSIARNTENAEGATVLTADPDADAYTSEHVTKVLDQWKAEGAAVTGASYPPAQVVPTEGGR